MGTLAETLPTEAMAEDKDKQPERDDVHRRQRSKNLTMLLVLGGLALLFYVVAIVRMSGG